MKIIQEHIDELFKLCRQYHVAELFAFGSVVSGKFTKNSDIDFLVKFSDVQVINNHALNARNEMKVISNEFIELAKSKGYRLREFEKLVENI